MAGCTFSAVNDGDTQRKDSLQNAVQSRKVPDARCSQFITTPYESEVASFFLKCLYSSVNTIFTTRAWTTQQENFQQSFQLGSDKMAVVKARCQIMENALPAGPLKIQQPFYVVEDQQGEHMIFCIDQTSRLCLVMKASSGKNELLPLHDQLELGAGRAVSALAVSQNYDGKINVVFTIRQEQGGDRLYVLLPMPPTRDVWTNPTTLKAAMCSGDQEAVRVRNIMLVSHSPRRSLVTTCTEPWLTSI